MSIDCKLPFASPAFPSRWLSGLFCLLALAIASLLAAPGANAADRIYWANFGPVPSIAYANLDGSGSGGTVNTSGATLQGPHGSAIDAARGRIYWANWAGDTGTTISYANLDGSGGGDLDIQGATISGPHGLAIDPTVGVAGRLYWPNHADNSISYADLDGLGGGVGGDLTITNATVDEPRGMTIDPVGGRVYWSNYSAGDGMIISYANLDGSGDGDLLETNGLGPEGTAIDPLTRKIYWSDWGDKRLIESADIDGTDVQPFNTTGATPRGVHGVAIDPDARRLYWANYNGDSISWANLDGSGGQELNTSGTTTSNPVLPSLLKVPAGAGPPAISGGSVPGATLSCSPGTWAGDVLESLLYRAPQSLAYQWTLNGADLPGAEAGSITANSVGSYRCRVTATNAAGSTSQTSAAHAVNGTQGPAPTLTSTNPASPATATTPKIKGTSPAAGTGYRIKLYVNDPTCSGSPAAESNVATFQGKGVAVGPLAVGTSQIRATLTDPAGVASACSPPISYTRLGGPAPTLTSTNPASPATATTPKIKGTSPAAGTGYRIKLYVNDPTCSGSPAAESNVATFQGKGVAVGPLAVGTSQIRATLTDPAGVASACSSPISYTRLG